ncbi:MAG: MBL fold metallo-hydrolase [Acidobacteriota bacterium]
MTCRRDESVRYATYQPGEIRVNRRAPQYRSHPALCLAWTIAFAAALPTLADAPATQAEVSLIDVLHLAGPVYMLRSNTPIGNPTTVVSVGTDGAFVVDPNLAAAGEALDQAIQQLGGGGVRLVASTHYHGDHTEGLELFVPPAIAIAPGAQRQRLATGEVVLGERPVQASSLPAITFDDALRLHWNGEVVEIFTPRHKNGHTDGDAFIYFSGSGVLCVGDYLFLDKYPLIDVDAGGDLEGYLANVDDLLARFPPETLIVPGHGTFEPTPIETVSMERLAANLKRLRETIEIVRRKLRAGKTLDELIAEGLPERYAAIGERPRFVSEERWIRFLHSYYSER